ncbi:MAG: SMP-30/gluconolactonase/LRE family protein [Ferruginibacter sp.]
MMKYALLIVFVLLITIATAFTKHKRMSQVIWKVTTVAGGAKANKATDGTGLQSRFTGFMGNCTVDFADELYVIDNSTLRKMDTGGIVTSLMDIQEIQNKNEVSNYKFIPGEGGICIDKEGNIYVSNKKDAAIYKIKKGETAELYAGNRDGKSGELLHRLSAEITNPNAICLDKAGNMYVANDYSIQKISVAGLVTTLAGESTKGIFRPGLGKAATFSKIKCIAVDRKANIYVGQYASSGCIAKISPQGEVSNFVGHFIDTKIDENPDGTGREARFMKIQALAFDEYDNLIVGETTRIRKVSPEGNVITIAGSKISDWKDGLGTEAMFNNIGGLCVDSKGNILVSDQFCIRKMTMQYSNR